MKPLRHSPLWALLLAGPLTAAEPVDYVRDVKPLLARHCVGCHGPAKQRAGLRLDTAAAARVGGNSGPAVLPGKAADSRLFQALHGSDGLQRMPPKDPRPTPAEVVLLRRWIDEGAKAPANERAAAGGTEASRHWAFLPPRRTPPPVVKQTAWARNSVDRFILARLEREGLTPSSEADPITLLRRVSLDLTGLPPTVHEVETFLADRSPGAYERAVDRLLASPHYGERWGRHWLDQARYADSNGFTIDGPRSIWKYRDWVIDAFNRDLPFDRFITEQMAGDLLPGATVDQRVATGFHRNTLVNQEGGVDQEQFRVEAVVDRVNTTGSVFLGLTVGCCQCHDHKFDPLSQREYYQLFAFLNSADEPSLEVAPPDLVRRRDAIRARLDALERRRKGVDFTSAKGEDAWEKALSTELRTKLPKDVQAALAVPENGRNARQKATLTGAYRKTDMTRHLVAALGGRSPLPAAAEVSALLFRLGAEKQAAEIKTEEPAVPTTLVLQERKKPRMTNVHIGGDFTRKGAEVGPGVPAVLHPLPTAKGANRLDLARWLVDRANPLTARVAVNRSWMVLFGTGLVETENDFGTQGTPPTHPELLDWLALEFQERGWSVKEMHRLLVTSATYRQSSHARPDLAVADARNRLLARQNRLRLEAEVVRDVAVAASGLLSRRVGGPSVFPPQPDGVYRFTQINKEWKADNGPDRYRRGMYTYFWRSAPHPGLTVFDAPDANSTCTRRNRSNTPLQALTLLNDAAFYEFAQALAARLLAEEHPGDSARLRHGFQVCLARSPSPHEQQRLQDLLGQQRAKTGSEAVAWTTVARVLLNLDEFITRE